MSNFQSRVLVFNANSQWKRHSSSCNVLNYYAIWNSHLLFLFHLKIFHKWSKIPFDPLQFQTTFLSKLQICQWWYLWTYLQWFSMQRPWKSCLWSFFQKKKDADHTKEIMLLSKQLQLSNLHQLRWKSIDREIRTHVPLSLWKRKSNRSM